MDIENKEEEIKENEIKQKKNRPDIPPAPWHKRLLNYIIDLLIVSIIFQIILKSVYSVNTNELFALNEIGNNSSYRYLSPSDIHFLKHYAKWLIFLVYFFYYLILESVFSKTVGKFITGTIVVDLETNKKVNFDLIFGRSILRFIPFEQLSYFEKFPYGWHDSIAHTYVTTNKAKYFFENGLYKTTIIEKLNNYFIKDILKEGYKRILFIASAIIPIIFGVYFGRNEYDDFVTYDSAEIFAGILIGLLLFWLLYAVTIWIYRGFKKDAEKKNVV